MFGYWVSSWPPWRANMRAQSWHTPVQHRVFLNFVFVYAWKSFTWCVQVTCPWSVKNVATGIGKDGEEIVVETAKVLKTDDVILCDYFRLIFYKFPACWIWIFFATREHVRALRLLKIESLHTNFLFRRFLNKKLKSVLFRIQVISDEVRIENDDSICGQEGLAKQR